MARKISLARQLRRAETDAERTLWLQLRDRRLGGWKFRRQAPVGPYVLDFLCADGRLIVELDGGQHAERCVEDRQRTRTLEAMGYLVLRFWNTDVLTNMSGVLEVIAATLSPARREPPHPAPLPSGEREKNARTP
jgi:very-short-patch-repair endonuclease